MKEKRLDEIIGIGNAMPFKGEIAKEPKTYYGACISTPESERERKEQFEKRFGKSLKAN